MKHFATGLLLALLFLFRVEVASGQQDSAAQIPTAQNAAPLRIGWIGAMSGPVAKYGAYQSAVLAEEDVNAAGGISGHPLQLLFEDGKGEGKTASTAAQKLLSAEHVQFIVGGHCTPESFPISSIVQQNHALMLAAITTSPKLTDVGDNVFRVSPVSTSLAEKIVPYAMTELHAARFAILFEETDYARPVAERFKDLAKQRGAEVVYFDSYNPGEPDFLAQLTRIRGTAPDALYLGTQAPESALQVLKQMGQLHLKVKLLGNEITGNAVTSVGTNTDLLEGMVFAEPDFNPDAPATKAFIEHYKQRFNVQGLPMGYWSAEAYDAVRLLSSTIARCGNSVEAVKTCLYATKEYGGVSGSISIDKNGDGIRQYVLKVIRAGKVSRL